jgi:hypothetical protein
MPNALPEALLAGVRGESPLHIRLAKEREQIQELHLKEMSRPPVFNHVGI